MGVAKTNGGDGGAHGAVIRGGRDKLSRLAQMIVRFSFTDCRTHRVRFSFRILTTALARQLPGLLLDQFRLRNNLPVNSAL